MTGTYLHFDPESRQPKGLAELGLRLALNRHRNGMIGVFCFGDRPLLGGVFKASPYELPAELDVERTVPMGCGTGHGEAQTDVGLPYADRGGARSRRS